MFNKTDSASVNFMISSVIWVLLGVSMGLILALQFIIPDLFHGIPWLVFGRLRQAHTNTVMFAWLSMGMMGLWLYILPRLTGRRLWSERLANLSMVLWNLAVAGGIFGLLAGASQGREYAEFIYPVDLALVAAVLMTTLNVYMTVAHRTESKLYVSVWYMIGTLVWMPCLYVIGNVMWHPATGSMTGIADTMYNWFYGHNILGLWFTTGLLPVVYYMVPKMTRTPLYSHALSLVAFWGIIFFYTGVGAHHLLWTPIPYWVKTFSVAESIGMILPVVAFMMNIWMTMRGNWNSFFRDIPLRFVITGWAAYILVSYQGSHQSLRAINNLTHFTQYVPGHAHLSLLFFAATIVMGGIFYALPKILGCRLYSRQLANIQYSLLFVGFLFFFSGFTLTGLVQGTAWVNQGLPVWSVLPGLRPYMLLRAVGGVLVVLSFFLFTWNVLATVIARKPVRTPPGVRVHPPFADEEDGESVPEGGAA